MSVLPTCLEKYDLSVENSHLNKRVQEIQKITESSSEVSRPEIMGFLDLTSLGAGDNEEKISGMLDKVNNFKRYYPEFPPVAALCVYPVFIPLLKKKLTIPTVKKASVAASFPSSQTFIEIKKAEMQRIIDEGADEADIVISLGRFLGGDYNAVFDEVYILKEISGDISLKVILETGMIKNPLYIRIASLLALEAGADFIKTSTGKNGPGASPESMLIMAEAVGDYFSATGRKAGLKPAGGISNYQTALVYYETVKQTLGESWLTPSLFRIGASRLANDLLGKDYF